MIGKLRGRPPRVSGRQRWPLPPDTAQIVGRRAFTFRGQQKGGEGDGPLGCVGSRGHRGRVHKGANPCRGSRQMISCRGDRGSTVEASLEMGPDKRPSIVTRESWGCSRPLSWPLLLLAAFASVSDHVFCQTYRSQACLMES